MDVAWLWLLFFTGSGNSPILADPIARRTFLVPSHGALIVETSHGALIVVPTRANAVQV